MPAPPRCAGQGCEEHCSPCSALEHSAFGILHSALRIRLRQGYGGQVGHPPSPSGGHGATADKDGGSHGTYKHLGLYAYRRDFLLRLAALPQTALEQAESLEQLRALEHGFRVRAVETQYDSIGVDTPEDLEHVRKACLAGARGA